MKNEPYYGFIDFFRNSVFLPDFIFIVFAFAIVFIALSVLNLLYYFKFKEIKYSFTKLADILLLVCSICIVGYSVGSISGNTNGPVINVLLPLLFSFIAGLTTFGLAKDKIHNKKTISILIFSFLIFTIMGLHVGGRNRDNNLIKARALEQRNIETEMYRDLRKKIYERRVETAKDDGNLLEIYIEILRAQEKLLAIESE